MSEPFEGDRVVSPDGVTGTLVEVDYSEAEGAFMGKVRQDDGVYRWWGKNELKHEALGAGSNE